MLRTIRKTLYQVMAILLTKLASFEEKREKPQRAMRILSSNGLFESFSSYINSTTLSRLQQTFRLSLPTKYKTPTSGRKPDDYQPRAQISRFFKRVSSKLGIKKESKSFLKNTLFRKGLLQIILSI